MKPQKKVEIIIESVQKNKIITFLEKLEINGYSVIPSVMGKGAHGYHDSKGLSNTLSNTYFMTICSSEKAHELAQAIKPLIDRYGGICILSDVTIL